jgi:hypothetical protein
MDLRGMLQSHDNYGEKMAYFNQHSFTIIGVITVIIFGFLLFRNGIRVYDLIGFGALILGFGIAFYFLRPGPGTEGDAETIMARIGEGTPVLVEFQSNY